MGKERIQWLALLRGLNILLVVMFHVQLIDMATGESHQFYREMSYPFSLSDDVFLSVFDIDAFVICFCLYASQTVYFIIVMLVC